MLAAVVVDDDERKHVSVGCKKVTSSFTAATILFIALSVLFSCWKKMREWVSVSERESYHDDYMNTT